MELLLIIMDHHKIHNSFEFKLYLGIKYREFVNDFTKCTNDIHCNLQYSIAYDTILAPLSQ